MATLKDFDNYLDELSRFGTVQNVVQEHKSSYERDGTGERSVYIYTFTNCYSIRAVERHGEAGYLGCIASCRKPRAGEGWTRGNDLADGPLSKETWHRILADIVSYELVQIHHPAEALSAADIEGHEEPPEAQAVEPPGEMAQAVPGHQ